jgi:signal transduction histidine kinase
MTEIWAPLRIAAFRRVAPRSFEIAGPLPEWCRADLDPARMTDEFLYLDHFLDEAEPFWEAGEPGVLRSGPWTQRWLGSESLVFGAIAVLSQTDSYLLIESLGQNFQDRQSASQKARELDLENDRLSLQAAHAEKMARLRTEVISSLSHELRTPLNSLLGFSRLLELEKAGPLNAKQKEFLGQVGRAGSHLLALVNSVLDWGGLSETVPNLTFENLLLREVVDEVRGLVGVSAEQKSIEIQVGVPELFVRADRLRLKQILYNLLSNGIKYSHASKEVDVKAWLKDEMVWVSVTDRGEGIPAENMPYLFDRYRRFDQHTDGTGLGLAITKLLVEHHGGSIGVTSVLGSETTFYFSIPKSSI